MYESSVRSATAGTAKTFLALFAVLSLLLSAFAIARPVIAHHDTPGSAVQPILVGPNDPEWNSNPGGNVPCPDGTTELKFEPTPDGDHEDSILLPDGSTATVSFTVSGNMITTFEVEGGLAAYVILKATNTSNVYDYSGFPGGGVAHDDSLVSPATDSISHVSFCLIPVEASILVYKTDQTGADVEGATFVVMDGDTVVGGPSQTDADGLVCFDGLVLDREYTVVETAAPPGWDPADPDEQTVAASLGSCDDREGGPDATFTNVLLGSLLVLKTDGEGAALDGATFTVRDADDNVIATATSGDFGEGFFCVDGLVFGATYEVTEDMAPEGFVADTNNPQSHDIDVAGDCDGRTAPADLTFVNQAEEEELGSITIQKAFDEECPVCPTRTPGFWFNRGGGGGVSLANELLPGLNITFPIGEGGSTTFDSVQAVLDFLDWDRAGGDGAMGLSGTAQLLRHYLALRLNVEAFDCPADEVTFDGMTIAEWLAAAEAVLNQGGSDETIKDALDAINNASLGDGTLDCPEGTTGDLSGFTFQLWLGGELLDEQTTGESGSVTFMNLELGLEYTIVEISPEGLECTIVSVSNDGAVLNPDGTISVTLTEENADITITVVNECEEIEEELGSVLVAKVDEEDEPLGGATFEIDGVAHADTDGDGFVCVDGLELGIMVEIVETIAPDGFIGDDEPQTVTVTSTLDCEERLDGATVADADAVFVNVPEDEEEEGELEVIKIFCPTVGDDLIFVFGPLFEEPIEGFGVQGMEDEDELPSTEGCTLGAPSEDALGAMFEITGGDLSEPLLVQTSWNEILTLNLAPGTYVITELGTGLSAEIEIAADGDTAVVVFNFLAEEEEDQGLVKILKFFCVGEGDVVFTIVNGDVNLGDPGVTLPENCEDPVVGDASFTLTRGALTSAVFTLGDDGARLIPLDPDTYVLNEVAPNEASSPPFAITANETTTVIVWNFEEGDEGEGPGEQEIPRGGELPGAGGPGAGQVPDTAMVPAPMGSVPAALLALVMLTGLGAAGYAMQAEARRRR